MLEPRAEREAIAGRRVVHPPETEAIRGHHEAPAVREPERDGEGPPEGTGKAAPLAGRRWERAPRTPAPLLHRGPAHARRTLCRALDDPGQPLRHHTPRRV